MLGKNNIQELRIIEFFVFIVIFFFLVIFFYFLSNGFLKQIEDMKKKLFVSVVFDFIRIYMQKDFYNNYFVKVLVDFK